MKTLNYQKLTTYEIPDGEGSTALPISFVYLRFDFGTGESTLPPLSAEK